MVNYNKSTIYKLCCKDTEITDEYVGSTTNFSRRKSGHKKVVHSASHKDGNLKVYLCIREYGGWINWDMVEIEKNDDKIYSKKFFSDQIEIVTIS